MVVIRPCFESEHCHAGACQPEYGPTRPATRVAVCAAHDPWQRFGFGGWGTACALGLSALLLASDLIWDLLEKAGQLYLIWLGSKLFWTPERLVLAPAVQQHGTRPQTLFQEAFLLAVINPKALLFFVALFPQSVDPNESFTLQITFLILTYCGLSICSLNTYAALATGLRSGVTQTRYTYFRKLSGLALVCFALTLSTS